MSTDRDLIARMCATLIDDGEYARHIKLKNILYECEKPAEPSGDSGELRTSEGGDAGGRTAHIEGGAPCTGQGRVVPGNPAGDGAAVAAPVSSADGPDVTPQDIYAVLHDGGTFLAFEHPFIIKERADAEVAYRGKDYRAVHYVPASRLARAERERDADRVELTMQRCLALGSIQRAEKAERERDEWKRDYTAVSEATGIMYEADYHYSPGPADAVVSRIKQLVALEGEEIDNANFGAAKS